MFVTYSFKIFFHYLAMMQMSLGVLYFTWQHSLNASTLPHLPQRPHLNCPPFPPACACPHTAMLVSS